jgi:hypothetical protein
VGELSRREAGRPGDLPLWKAARPVARGLGGQRLERGRGLSLAGAAWWFAWRGLVFALAPVLEDDTVVTGGPPLEAGGLPLEAGSLGSELVNLGPQTSDLGLR